ncbi:MAG TPA: signal peptidase I [Coriobacteriia bacterium]
MTNDLKPIGPQERDGLEPSLSHAGAEADEVRLPDSRAGGRPEEPMSFGRRVLELAVLLAVAWVLATGIKTYLVQPFEIPSSSMEDTLLIGDRVLVDKLAYRFGEPVAGDVVVFVSPEDGTTDLIKRVVAVGGQTVDIRDGILYVDGARAQDSYVNKKYPDHFDAEGAVTVPAGTVYVMGDNRANSKDSRYIGPQPVSKVLGRAFAIYWPVDRLSSL